MYVMLVYVSRHIITTWRKRSTRHTITYRIHNQLHLCEWIYYKKVRFWVFNEYYSTLLFLHWDTDESHITHQVARCDTWTCPHTAIGLVESLYTVHCKGARGWLYEHQIEVDILILGDFKNDHSYMPMDQHFSFVRKCRQDRLDNIKWKAVSIVFNESIRLRD